MGHTDFLSKDVRRFEFSATPVMPDPSSVVERIGGFSVTNHASIGTGIGPSSTAIDPFYDADADAWLLATVTYDVIGSGSTDLFLQIGKNGINQDGRRSSDVDVVFGGGADQPLNGEADRVVDSETPDGSIRLNGEYRRPDAWYEVPVIAPPATDPVTVRPPETNAGPGDANTIPEEPIDAVPGEDPRQSDGPVTDLAGDGGDRSGEDVPIFTSGEDIGVRPVFSIDIREFPTQGLAIPEPSTLLMLVIGLLSIAGAVRRACAA